jgi:translation initiation factor 1 (eIF-1/SUI1)
MRRVGNKDRKKSDARESPSKLAHNPFASLKDRLELPAAPPALAGAPERIEAREEASKPRSLGRLVQRRETKRRGGKAVVIVSGFAALPAFDRNAVEAIAKELKGKLGSGGTVEDGSAGIEIVIQGDQAKKVAELLRARGFRVDGVTT